MYVLCSRFSQFELIFANMFFYSFKHMYIPINICVHDCWNFPFKKKVQHFPLDSSIYVVCQYVVLNFIPRVIYLLEHFKKPFNVRNSILIMIPCRSLNWISWAHIFINSFIDVLIELVLMVLTLWHQRIMIMYFNTNEKTKAEYFYISFITWWYKIMMKIISITFHNTWSY